MPPRASRSQNPRVTVTPAPIPSSQASTSRTQGGHTSGEEFDFAAAEDNVTESTRDDVGSLPQTQPTSKSTKAHDINLIFKLIETEEMESDGTKVKKRICTWCENSFQYGVKTGTANLRKHLKIKHEERYGQTCKEQGWDYVAGKATAPTVGDNRKQALPPFSPETFLVYLVRWVTADDQAIRVVECPEFRDICMLLRETLTDKDIPRRDKLREAIIQQFGIEFKKLKVELSNSAGRISLTADIWSNASLRAFLAVTAHWIGLKDSKLEFKAALIGFHLLKKKHTGKNIARTIVHLTDRAGITKKIGHITLDNAENNATAMQELQVILNERDIEFDAKDNRIGCYPHIINICVSHIVSSCTKVKAAHCKSGSRGADFSDDDEDGMDATEEDDDEEEDDSDDDEEEDDTGNDDEEDEELGKWIEALKADPVKRARVVVRTVRSSGQRKDDFQKLIKMGNNMGSFKDEGNNVVLLKELQLLKDVRHRWDSLYLMLARLEELRPAVDRFFEMDPKLRRLKLSTNDWTVLDGLQIVLEAPHHAQQLMSAHATPVLSGALPSFELLMTQWEYLGKKYKTLKPWTDIGLEWARKYYNRMDDTRAYIIAIFINPCIRFSWFEREWDNEYIAHAKKVILEVMERCGGQQQTQAPVPTPPVRVPRFAKLSGKYKLPQHDIYPAASTGTLTAEGEFEKYRKGTLSPHATDLVDFWTTQKMEHPRLYAVAMDYLPIQASSVPCEHVFSSAAETDTKKRNRLSPILMECLQILKFILKKDRLNFSAGFKPLAEPPVTSPSHTNLLSDLLTQDSDETTDRLLKVFGEDDTDDEV